MSAKHTPGPWMVYRGTDGAPIIGIGTTLGDGVTDPRFGLWCDGEEREANANLIAAAPELLKALKLYDAYRALPTDFDGPTGAKHNAYAAFVAAKDAALRKAEGGAA